MNLGATLGAGLTQGYSQSAQSSGSTNSAQSFNNSYNESMSESQSQSWTDARAAREWSAKAAEIAWERDMEAFQMQMDFNREEAQKQRDWQAEMANTIYTRSVKNMREAGINPILAYRMGLSGANVGSGATASLGGSPSAPLAQNFMDSFSASSSHSSGSGWGSGESNGSGSSWGSGWSNSENGIITALEGLGAMADTAIDGINAGNTLDMLNNYANGNPLNNWGESVGKQIKNYVAGGVSKFLDKVEEKTGKYLSTGGGHAFKK